MHLQSVTSSPVLALQGLTVRIKSRACTTLAVRDVSFDVRRGETMCVVGESGSGKSVTALAVMGLLPTDALSPVAGQIVLEGEDLLSAAAPRVRALRASRMAMVFQEPMSALNPVMPIARQIDEVLRAHTGLGMAERRQRVVEMLDQVKLADAARLFSAYPHELSGGQRQRIMIAIALVMNPGLLIADEPTTALDVTTQKQILALIRELQERHGTAVLFITHDMGVVAEVAQRVTVMQGGRVVESGSVEEVLRQPRDSYTRALLSAVPSLVPRQPRHGVSREPLLETKGLTKTYRQSTFFGRRTRLVRAARDVDLVVHKGETFGIVGESGSGKSTVARCVMRLVQPGSGSIRIDGIELATLSRRELQPHRKRFQIVFQDPYRSLNPRLTVGESLIEGPMNYGVKRSAAVARAEELLRLVGLRPDAAGCYPHQFSGGQRQRIAIARALALEPEVLVADEAVSALDVSVQAQVLRLLQDLQERFSISILFITHDLRAAAQICDRIAVMHKGRVVEQGTAQEVLLRPTHEYTRSLISAAPGRHWDFANFRPSELFSTQERSDAQ